MNKRNRYTVMLAVCLAVATLAVATWAMQGDKLEKISEIVFAEDNKLAIDLAALSGIPKPDILKLYKATGSWDTVRDNIFVFKKILQINEKHGLDVDEAIELIGQNQPKEILTVFEYLDSTKTNLRSAQNALKERKNGASMEQALALASTDSTYKVYKPAGEAQIRKWLNSGFTPQDIINADLVASSKDKSISEVLAAKTTENSWEAVGVKFGYQFNETSTQVAQVNIQGVTGKETLSGKDYESIVKDANNKANKDTDKLKKQLQNQSNLTEEDLNKYTEQGLSLRDVENAARLAKKSKVGMDDILNERKQGKEWEALIKEYAS